MSKKAYLLNTFSSSSQQKTTPQDAIQKVQESISISLPSYITFPCQAKSYPRGSLHITPSTRLINFFISIT